MVFFYRRFLPLDVYKYAFGVENDASSSNLPIPLVKPKEAVSNFSFETASFTYKSYFNARDISSKRSRILIRTGHIFSHLPHTIHLPALLSPLSTTSSFSIAVASSRLPVDIK